MISYHNIYTNSIATNLKPVKNVIKTLIGDYNAKIGKKRIYEPTFGKEGAHKQTDDNGSRLISLETVSSTTFSHRNINKWKSPDGHTQNQIDKSYTHTNMIQN